MTAEELREEQIEQAKDNPFRGVPDEWGVQIDYFPANPDDEDYDEDCPLDEVRLYGYITTWKADANVPAVQWGQLEPFCEVTTYEAGTLEEWNQDEGPYDERFPHLDVFQSELREDIAQWAIRDGLERQTVDFLQQQLETRGITVEGIKDSRVRAFMVDKMNTQ